MRHGLLFGLLSPLLAVSGLTGAACVNEPEAPVGTTATGALPDLPSGSDNATTAERPHSA